jgi:hypothetical protein
LHLRVVETAGCGLLIHQGAQRRGHVLHDGLPLPTLPLAEKPDRRTVGTGIVVGHQRSLGMFRHQDPDMAAAGRSLLCDIAIDGNDKVQRAHRRRPVGRITKRVRQRN